jgi:DNA (cytosine-5)-methyltransferase 1
LCAGGGGQALGFEQAGIDHLGLVELDKTSCETLRFNRPHWRVVNSDLNAFDAADFAGADLVSAGLPCPPFSVAGSSWAKRTSETFFPR